MPRRNSSPPQSSSVTCFGVGDGWPCADRRHSSFLYRFGDTRFLIDCGEGLSSSFERSGEDYEALDRIFLSHLHSDHIGGFPMFVQGLWLERRRRPLPVSLPAEGIRPLRAMLETSYLFDELVGFQLRFEALKSKRTMRVGEVRVTPFPTQHLATLKRYRSRGRGQRFECFSFLIEAPGRRVAHTADIGAAADLEPLVAEPLDHLVCELAHAEPEAICEVLHGRPIRRVTFIHLSRQLWTNRPATRRLLRSRLGGIPFRIAKDGETISI